jgi:hypothetical protein
MDRYLKRGEIVLVAQFVWQLEHHTHQAVA